MYGRIGPNRKRGYKDARTADLVGIFVKGDEGIYVHKSEDLKSKSCKRDLTVCKINTCKLKMLYN